MQEVSHLGVLGVHVELVLLIAGHLDGLTIDHLETETIESVDLGRIVGHEDELMNAQIGKDRGACAIFAEVGSKA